MGIRDHPVAPRSPWQNAYIERVIGSVRVSEIGDRKFKPGQINETLLAHYYADVRREVSAIKLG